MREIKFRAWDKDNNRFLKPFREEHSGALINYLSIGMDGSFKFSYTDVSGYSVFIGDTIEERFDVMQYTGLLDTNGLEVYEGDIVVCYLSVSDVDNDIKEVKYVSDENLGCGFLPMIEHDFDNGLVYDSYEIIGNIYEHSHLLDK